MFNNLLEPVTSTSHVGYYNRKSRSKSDSQIYDLWWQWNIYTWRIHLKAFVLCAIYQSMFLVRKFSSSSQIRKILLYHYVFPHQILYVCQISHWLYFSIYCLNKILRKYLKLRTFSTFLVTYWKRLALPRVFLFQLTFPFQNLIWQFT